jgi:hypothetical protein
MTDNSTKVDIQFKDITVDNQFKLNNGDMERRDSFSKNISIGKFKWRSAPYSSFGYIWPSENTYHELLHTDESELIKTFNAIDTPENEDKDKIKKEIEQIVNDGPFIIARASLILWLAFFVIVFLIMFAVMELRANRIVFAVVGGLALVILVYKIYRLSVATGEGYNRWNEIVANIKSKQSMGKLLDVHDSAAVSSQHQQQQQQQQPANAMNTVASSFLNGFGNAIGNNLFNKNKKR